MKFAWYGAIAALASSAFLYQQGTANGGDGPTQLFLQETLTMDQIAFIDWSAQHGKSYRTREEWKFRFQEFKRSLDEIAKHDEEYHGSSVGLNEFSDNTKEEWKRMFGYKRVDRALLEEHGPKTEEHSKESDATLQIASSKNWYDDGAVTKVKNQGVCGSCWTFAATGGLEGAYFLKKGKLVDLSEQQILDCVRSGICAGCKGGHQYYAWRFFLKNNQGVTLQSNYRYTGKDTAKCKPIAAQDQYAFVQKYEWVEKNAMMLKVRLNYRPVAVSIEGESDFFRHYRGGIISKGCGSNLDHAILAVGYGTEKGKDYFIIKNSWGTSWGERGFARIAIDQCGITQEAVSVYVD